MELIDKILQDLDAGSLMMDCLQCHQEKSIPVIRTSQICDDCLDGFWEAKQAEERANAAGRRVIAQRIPERYRLFDTSKLEGGQEGFIGFTEPGKSLAIFGEIGTGKTNYACQILKARALGAFYVATEINNKRLAEKIQDEPVLVIDDLTEVDSTDNRIVDALFGLFNYRYNQAKDTIITISKTYDEVQTIFGDSGLAMVSRFRQWMFSLVLKQKWR